MKISKKVECGIVAIVDIALHSVNGESVTVESISKRRNISIKYLEQILPSLRQANLIQSTKGCRGGYAISRQTDEITLKDIINALDITILNDCYLDNNDSCTVINNTVYELFWKKSIDKMQSCAENITLEKIVQKCSEAMTESNQNFMYYI